MRNLLQLMIFEIMVIMWAFSGHMSPDNDVQQLDDSLAKFDMSLHRHADSSSHSVYSSEKARKHKHHRHKSKKRKYAWLDDTDTDLARRNDVVYSVKLNNIDVATGTLDSLSSHVGEHLACAWLSKLASCRS